MIKTVSLTQGTTFADAPWRFEAGSPNTAGIMGLGAAIDYVTELGLLPIQQYEQSLMHYALAQLSQIKSLTLYGPTERAGVIAFNLGQHHAYDVGSFLDQYGIAIRTGHHCAMPLMAFYQVPSMCRASLALYNTREDVDRLVAGLQRIENCWGESLSTHNRQHQSRLFFQQSAFIFYVFRKYAMAGLPDRDKLIRNFSRCLNWEEKYLYIIELGGQLAPLTEQQRHPENLISGCQSQVWIAMTLSAEGHVIFAGDSDAAIVKGLVAVVFILYHDLTPQQIISLDVRPFFADLALSQHLTPSRSQGLEAMIRAIRTKVANLSAH